VTFSRTDKAVVTRSGIRVLADRVVANWPAERQLPAIGNQQPARALDEALRGITGRYGVRTADFVAMQLEYPRPAQREDRGSWNSVSEVPFQM
jgi:hypothetical protein